MAYIPYSPIVDDASDDRSISSLKKRRGNQDKKTTGYIPYSPIVDDMSDDDGISSVNSQLTTDDISFDEKDLSVWDALRTHGINGFWAGHSDEIQAALEAGVTDYWSGDKKAEEVYNRRVAKERAYQKALEEKHPWWSSGAYFLGSLAPVALSFVPGFQWLGAGGLLRGGSTLGNWGRAALVGAGSGALHGAGAGEGLEDKLLSAGVGGAIGSVAGPVGSVAGTFVSSGVDKIRHAWQSAPFIRGGLNPAYKDVPNKAVREVARTLYDDGVENVAERLASAPRGAFLTDISPNLEVSLANTGQINRHVSDIVNRAHGRRMQGAVDRLRQSADENITPLQDVDIFKSMLKEQGEKTYKHLYDKALAVPVGEKYYPALDKLFENEGFQEAVERAVKILKKDRRKAKPEAFYSRDFKHINYKPTMELLDQTKQSLDYFVRKHENLGDNQMVSIYQSLKKDLVDITDRISPTYKAARDSVAKYAGFEEAISKGKNITKRDVSGVGIAEGLQKGAMPNGVNSYRVGMRDYVDDILKGPNAVRNLSNILQTGRMTDNLSRSLSSKELDAFRRAVDEERFYQDAAKRGVKPFLGTPEPSPFTGVNLPYSKGSTARAGAKMTQNLLSDTIRKLPQKERQLLERDIAKLATFGVKGMSQQEVVEILQRFINLHKKGIKSEYISHVLSSALTRQAGVFARSKLL
ncbi:glycine zipper family protein [Bartonella machadoae]|uniref:glycine zipper family protein n=1 Tax=Bartonella machadoae TaxID=2893471 RepID=UPI001F4C8EE9|nr:glycine zipper family protein [Bartonella machadoae]UNE54976.1 glycine zipper family protein [Bartonella machadoae]UNE55366.1 glycine zipper family protein [Bartonella machadoae]